MSEILMKNPDNYNGVAKRGLKAKICSLTRKIFFLQGAQIFLSTTAKHSNSKSIYRRGNILTIAVTILTLIKMVIFFFRYPLIKSEEPLCGSLTSCVLFYHQFLAVDDI